MLHKSVEHANKREMFDVNGGTEADLPQIKSYLGEMAMKSAALEAVSEMTSALIEEKGDDMNIIDICAAIKVISTEWNWDAAQLAMKIHGGAGTRRNVENGMERDFRDAWIGLIVEGVNEAMKQVVVALVRCPPWTIPKPSSKKLSFNPLSKAFWKMPLIPFSQENKRLLSGFVPARFEEKGILDKADAKWIQSRTNSLWRRSTALGAINQKKMMLEATRVDSSVRHRPRSLCPVGGDDQAEATERHASG